MNIKYVSGLIILGIGGFLLGRVSSPPPQTIKQLDIAEIKEMIQTVMDSKMHEHREEMRSYIQETTASLRVKANRRREVITTKGPDGSETHREIETDLSETHSETNTSTKDLTAGITDIRRDLKLIHESLKIDNKISERITTTTTSVNITAGIGYQFDGKPRYTIYKDTKIIGTLGIQYRIGKIPIINTEMWAGLWGNTSRAAGVSLSFRQ